MEKIRSGFLWWVLFSPVPLYAAGQVVEALNYLLDLVNKKYQVSTTGYQASMFKPKNRITEKRAFEYYTRAKELYPLETLKNLGVLQRDYINKIPQTGELSDPHHMNDNQLTSILRRFRLKNFANCEGQALEIAIHLWALGFKKFAIISNKAISHNYVLIMPTNVFPNGAILDPWSGYPVRELDLSLRITYKHYDRNISVVPNMMKWVKKNAKNYANKNWIMHIRIKFFRNRNEPLKAFLK